MFTLAKKTYEAKKYGFNFLCFLEEHNVEATTGLPLIRAYVAYCIGISIDEAGELIEDHIVQGGSLDELYTIISEAIEKSNFMKVVAGEENA